MREAFVAALDEVSIIRISGIVQRRGAKENCGQRISRHILDPLPADVNWGSRSTLLTTSETLKPDGGMSSKSPSLWGGSMTPGTSSEEREP